ncbi:M1 family aminopeptidase [Vicingaceae bacterium]|nr:M1 family aminopeptidase [Vicingaceae bacterium]
MFKEFFLLEIKSALKRPMVYIFFLIVALLSFFAVITDSITIGGSVGNVMKNAPVVITQFVGVFSIIGVLFAVAFFNNAALRDYNNQFNEILFSTPISKASFLFGRFFGALMLSTIPLLGVYLGVVLGSSLGPILGSVSAERIGPLFLETFVNNYLLFILPNMFIAGVIVFALAIKFKNTVVSFVGAFGLIVAYSIAGTLLSDVDNETIAALADTFGDRAWTVESRYFTPMEKNTVSPGFSGILFLNRLVWLGIGAIVLIVTYLNFSFKEKQSKAKKQNVKNTTFQLIQKPQVSEAYSSWLQFSSFFKISFLNIIKSVVFKVIFLFALILLVSNIVGGYEYFGLKSYPLTYIVIDMINGSTTIFFIIIIVFFSGELVWNDRSSKIDEVINATPHSSISSLLGKVATLVGVSTFLYIIFSVIGITYQLILGFTFIEFGLYFTNYLYEFLPNYLFFSILFTAIQVFINNKYLGYFVAVLLTFLLDIILFALDVNTNMINLGSRPSLSYSDMNGFGPGALSASWFSTYWLLFGGILLVLSAVFWVRSTGGNAKTRWKLVRVNLKGRNSLILAVVSILWLGTASYVYYNTQILNSYETRDEQEQISVDYEKQLKKYESITLPKVKEIVYTFDIFPNKRDVKAKADLIVKNESNKAIDSIHYNINSDTDPKFTIPNGSLVFDDERLGYRIYELNSPLQPGEFMKIKIEVDYISEGFENGRGSTNIVRNGTFLNNRVIPQMGYNSGAEIADKNDRIKFELPPKSRMPALYEGDSCTADCMTNYLSEGRSDWIKTETFISTSSDQIAIAPGSLVKEWQEGDRNYYHYKVDEPSQDFCSFISADFEVAKRDWNGISLEVYYDEKHAYNTDLMLDAIQKSLEYYIENFGPYYHKQARIIEFPNYSTFAQAFPGTMPYSESFGFIIDLEDTTKNNVIDAVVAHEMAHQWWAHQLLGANMQGGTMLSEAFSEYSSLMVMKQKKSPLEMKEFLNYDFNRYLRGRGGETENELPLYKVENQQYIHYGKGSVILYALQDYIGEDKVNLAMSNFLAEFRYKAPPYPTSLDFLRHLEPQVPDSLNYLIEDWFKSITLYDFRLKEATYVKNETGKYKVTLEMENRKLKADTVGNEIEVPLNDWVDVGLFKDSEGKELLALERIKFNGNMQSYTFTVDTIPAKAAIDPKRILIERVYEKDNFNTVSEKE